MDIATLGANHIHDGGPGAIADTIAALRAQGIQTAGAGLTLEEARQPAIVEEQGVRVGLLSYNCAGPRTSWASAIKAGCAYVHALTHYQEALTIAGPAKTYSFVDFDTLEWMEADIERLRARVDVLVVAFQKGSCTRRPSSQCMNVRSPEPPSMQVLTSSFRIMRILPGDGGLPVHHLPWPGKFS